MLELTKIKAIGLDLDDTLWAVWPVIIRAEAHMIDWLTQRAPDTAAVFADPVRKQALRQGVVSLRPELGHNMSALRLECIRVALVQSGEDATLAQAAFDVFFEQRLCVDLFADVLPALAFLSARYPVVVVSNGNADVGRIGIGAHFAADVSAHLSGIGKPDVRIFHAAAQAVGVAPDEVLHVGDDPKLDVWGGLNAGMQTVWVNRDRKDWPHTYQPHASVRDLEQLCGLLQAAD